MTDNIHLGKNINTEVPIEAVSSFSNYAQVVNIFESFEYDAVGIANIEKIDTSVIPKPVTLQYEPDEVIVSIEALKLSTVEIKSKTQRQPEDLLLNKNSAELSECYYLPYYINSKTGDYINFKLRKNELSWEDVITYVDLSLDHEFYTNIDGITNPNSLSVLVNKYNQLPSDYVPGNLEEITSKYSSGSLSLRSDARMAFEAMCRIAGSEGVHLKAISAFRSFSYQASLYLKKKTSSMTLEEYQKERDRVSARAGHSEHQTGLAVDINSMEQSFGNTTTGKWIADNSYKYGFILRYPRGKEVITGYDYEFWHFRYLGPALAKSVYDSGLSYDEFYIKNIIPFM